MNTTPRYYLIYKAPPDSNKGDGDHPRTGGHSNRKKAIKEANFEARTCRGHPDYQGGTFEVWDRRTQSPIHSTTVIL